MVTTPTPTPTRSLTPLLAAAGVVAALAVAVGVWVLPKSVVDPRPAEVSISRIDGEGVARERWDPIEAQEWTALVADFERLREPEIVAVPDPDPDPGDDGGELVAQRPLAPRSVRPPWSYEGLISEPGGAVAVIRTQRGQRLVYVGDTIAFSERRGVSVLWEVAEATPERLLLRRGEEEFEYEMLRVGASTLPEGAGGRRGDAPTTPRPAVAPEEVGS